uniref:Uncharacterized protein n=1 Tax=Avena sativa TaxID=4498 RepID=A0ACD6AK78_AVESA
MAAASFALALLLYLGLDLPEASSAQSYAAQWDTAVVIFYGSAIKLIHERTKFRLHSHDVLYGSGSGQQSVTSFLNVDDANSYWIVIPQPDTSAKQGHPITHRTILRLQHMRTRKWLHSHLHASPITGNLEDSLTRVAHQWVRVLLQGRPSQRKRSQFRLRQDPEDLPT